MFYMIPNKKDLSLFKEDLILPLKDYSVGFDVYFDREEIESIAKTRSTSVIINSFLHKDSINNIKNIIDKMPHVKYFFVEDLGLTNLIDKDRIVLFQNHIINNYDSINYFSELNIKNIVISNELTIDEINLIMKNTSSNLFYFLINRNMLMYSKRKLLSSYYEHKDIDGEKTREIEERVSKKHLIIKEENGVTSIYDKNIFSANRYLRKLEGLNFIINFSNLTDEEAEIARDYYNKENIDEKINVDNYFITNKIIYKVGD